MQSLPWTFTNRFISTAPKLNIPNDCSKEMKMKLEKFQEERTQIYLYKIWETMNEDQKMWWITK
jgi:hypothetical protein